MRVSSATLTLSLPMAASVTSWSMRSWESAWHGDFSFVPGGFPGSHGPTNQTAMIALKGKERVNRQVLMNERLAP